MNFTGYEFLKRWEGERLQAYRDGGGVWTIGVGHTKDVRPGQVITPEQSKRFLDEDIAWAAKAVNDRVKVPITQNQFNALVSLCFNIGPDGFARSTALTRVNQRNWAGAAEALTWWNKDQDRNGRLVVVPGLVNRRNAEKELFLTPDLIIPEVEVDQVEVLVRKFVADLKALWDKE